MIVCLKAHLMRYLTRCLLLCLLPLGANAAECPALLNHEFKTLQGQTLDLCQFADKTLLVVNTASKCGFTRQFETLEAMDRKYRDKGLVVIGFPSNDFKQELKNNREIGSFCKLTYGVKFPMVEAGAVSGPNANSFFKQLSARTGQSPQWNFHKYLITPGARQVTSFSTETEPDGPQIMKLLTPHLK